MSALNVRSDVAGLPARTRYVTKSFTLADDGQWPAAGVKAGATTIRAAAGQTFRLVEARYFANSAGGSTVVKVQRSVNGGAWADVPGLGALTLGTAPGVAVPSGPPPYASTVLADSPYAYWRMGGASSPLADSTAGGRSLAVSAATLGAAGAVDGDGAASFNGTSSYGSVALDLSDTNVVSLEFWLKKAAWANDDQLAFEFTPSYSAAPGSFLVDPNESSTGAFYFGVNGNVGLNGRTFPRPSAGGWHHYVLTWNFGNPAASECAAAYVDGVAQTLTAVASAGLNENGGNFANSTLYLMSRAGSSLFGSGTLDEVAIYKSALSAATVAAHYQARVGAPLVLTLADLDRLAVVGVTQGSGLGGAVELILSDSV